MTYYSFAQQAHVFESEYQGYKPYTDGWETFPFAGMTLEECAEAAHKEAIRLLDEAGDFYAAAVEDSDEGEYRNRTLEEIMQELKEDVPYLETHLYWWMVEAGEGDEDPQDDDTKPLYQIGHPLMGDWDAPATITEIEQAVAQWHTRGANYTVKVDLGSVYIYVELDEVNHGTDEDGDMWATDSDFRPSSDNWIDLDGQRTSYRLEIGELYQPEDDQEPEPTAPTIPTAHEMAEQGLLLCTSSLGGRGITPASSIYIFSSYEDFIDQNPQWSSVQLPDPRWHGVTIIDIDLPVQGGYQAEWGGNPTRSGSDYTYYPY